MNIQCKLNFAAFTSCSILLLSVFSQSFHFPEWLQWALSFGVFVPLGFVFYYAKKLKLEKARQIQAGVLNSAQIRDEQNKARKTLIILWISLAPFTLSFPFWLPVLSGISFGFGGDFLIALVTFAIISVIFGMSLKRFSNQPVQLHPRQDQRLAGDDK